MPHTLVAQDRMWGMNAQLCREQVADDKDVFEIIKSLGLFENRMRGLRDVTSRFLRMPRFIIGSLPSFCSLFFRFSCMVHSSTCNSVISGETKRLF